MHAPLAPLAMQLNISGQPAPLATSHVCEQAWSTQMREAQSVPIAHASPSCPVIWQLPQLAVVPT